MTASSNKSSQNALTEDDDPLITNQDTYRASNTSRQNSSADCPAGFVSLDKLYASCLSNEETDLSSSKSAPALRPPMPFAETMLDAQRLTSTERSASLTMEDVSLLMREQDADLLESMHLDVKGTPLMMPQAPPAMPPDDFVLDESPVKKAPPCESSNYAIAEQSEHSVSQQCLQQVTHQKQQRRPTLSGEVWIQQPSLADDVVSVYSRSSHHNVLDQFIEEEDGAQMTSTNMRRLNEAAQFAEAVGDVPNEGELRIIDDDHGAGPEDDSMDSDDEKSVEIIIPNLLDKLPPANDGARRKRRPQWPFATTRGFFDKLPDNGKTQDFIYKGIRANPPEIVKRGINRGNYAQLHRKAWLEVSDKYHRYGKNLRLYYRHWESLGCPTNSFFDWLDSKGEAAGQPLPNLDDCPRAELDADTVLYIVNPEVTDKYAIKFAPDDHGRARVVDVDGDPVPTGPDGWIFVLRDNVVYGAQKVTSISGHSKKRFHHSSFFGGKAVAAAGIFITDDEGVMTKLYPHSGHYRPGEAHMQRVLFFLHNEGVDLRTFDMDMQQLLHVTRDKPIDGVGTTEKRKKVESVYLMPAVHVASFLAHKARFIGNGIFSQLHKIRKADVTSVTEALELIDSVTSRASVATPVSSV